MHQDFVHASAPLHAADALFFCPCPSDSLSPALILSIHWLVAVFPQCFCCSCGTEAQLLKHDTKMQSMKLTVAPSEKSPPTVTTFLSSSLLNVFHIWPIFPTFLLFLLCHSERKQHHHSKSLRVHSAAWQTNSLYSSHLVVLLLGCVKINDIFHTWSSRGAQAEPQFI